MNRERCEKVIPTTTETTSPMYLSGGAAVAGAGVMLAAVSGVMLAAVSGVTLVVAESGVTDSSPERAARVSSPLLGFLSLAGHECCQRGVYHCVKTENRIYPPKSRSKCLPFFPDSKFSSPRFAGNSKNFKSLIRSMYSRSSDSISFSK